jgi:hypothetical protein
LARNPEGMRLLGKLRHRLEINIEEDLRDVVKMLINIRVPSNDVNFLTSQVMVGFSRRTQLHGIVYSYLFAILSSFLSFVLFHLLLPL